VVNRKKVFGRPSKKKKAKIVNNEMKLEFFSRPPPNKGAEIFLATHLSHIFSLSLSLLVWTRIA